MCLAVPGKLIEIIRPLEANESSRLGTVDFQGTRIKVNLIFTPHARKGDWVLVHAGFAIRQISRTDALETWKYLEPGDVENELPIDSAPDSRMGSP